MPRLPGDISDATLRVVLARSVGPVMVARLRDHFGNDEKIVGASIAELRRVEGVGAATADTIRAGLDAADPAGERAAMEAAHASMIVAGDSDYPSLLASIHDPPPALWVRGELRPEDQVAVAIVGSRTCTAYGRDQAARFATLLSQSGLTIVSGGAIGIDAEAHRATVRVNGRTVVVLGCGVGVNYPQDHKDLFDTIAASHGALVSEFPTTMPPVAEHFPRRNRIISGLSLGVLVIEAGQRSGSLITARLAAEEHHREVMALPGRVDSPSSAGCLRAIKEGWASLVVDHADVMTQLESSANLLKGAFNAARGCSSPLPPGEGGERSEPGEGASVYSPATTTASLFDDALTPSQKSIMELLKDSGGDALLPDVIAAKTAMPMSQIMADLTLMQIRGRIRRTGDGRVEARSRS